MRQEVVPLKDAAVAQNGGFVAAANVLQVRLVNAVVLNERPKRWTEE